MDDLTTLIIDYKKTFVFGSLLSLLVMMTFFGCSEEASGMRFGAISTPSTRSVAPQMLNDEKSPASIYRRCAACHGAHGERSALDQSGIIGRWDRERLIGAMIGYRKGSYGGAMQTLMTNQVKDLSDAQIAALAEYITHLRIKTH